MKNYQDNPSALPALLRAASGVDTLETNSLCCAAAGVIAPSSATAGALIPHEKLRGAALADATLNAQERPLAQPVVGYKPAPTTSVRRTDWLDLNNIRPDQWLDPTLIDMPCAAHHTIEFGGLTAFTLLVTAAQKRIAELEQVNANLRECAVALNIDCDALNEQLLELLLERKNSTTQLATDTQLIEWLNQKGTYWDVSEFSQVSFPHKPKPLGYKHLRDALVEARQQDQASLTGSGA